ncbi:MAG: CotH kinase family protein [Verrucomicrobia bacterium]|nr:CotH kinase family protein [Verrucomicrobiota bacterium]
MVLSVTSSRGLRAVILALGFAVGAGVHAEPRITEFMAANTRTLADDRGDFSDWIEIHNPDTTELNLAGWYLTDSATNKTKWQFPAVTLPPDGYLLVWASNNSRRDPARPLHTNFALSASGEYLGLVKPDGTTVVSEFAPQFPEQRDDTSYGYARVAPGEPAAIGYFREPTPGTPNGGRSSLLAASPVTFSRASGPFRQNFHVTLGGAGPGERIRYVFAPPSITGPEIPLPTAESPEYTAPIAITFSVVIRAAVFGADNTPGPVTTVHYLKLDAKLAAFGTDLPVVVLDNLGAGALAKDRLDHPGWLYTYGAGSTPFTGPITLGTATTMAVRGNFTAEFPKSSFSLELKDDRGRTQAQPLFDLPAHQDWALVGPWHTDLSYIRNAFVYALSNRLGRWAPRTRFVETFLNEMGDDLEPEDYYGIGVLTERIKVAKDRVNLTPLEPNDDGPNSITGGYIIKLDVVPDPDHFTFVTDRGVPAREGTAVVVDTPTGSRLSKEQQAYIRGYVQQMEDTLFADRTAAFTTRTYLDYIDVPSWVDHHILQLVTGNVDALYRSEYFTKDRGGKLVSGPAWDFDGSMGNGDPRNAAWDTWETAGDVDVWNYGWFGQLVRDPEFMQAWVDRWQALRRREFSGRNLGALADSLAAEVGPKAAARDAARWPANASRFEGGFLGEVAHLKEWITQRAGWIDGQFVAPPQVADGGDGLTFTAPAGVQLVYTLDGSDPRSLGGGIAPNALVTSGLLTVPATTNVHVRSYDLAKKDAFPGSPWSSAAGGAQSSPLDSRARLANLSTRTHLTAEDGTLFAGLSLADTAGKGFIIRGVGPTLAAFGATDVLPDPELKIVRADGVETHRNAGWETGNDVARLVALTKSVGAFPLAARSADSAILATLPAGSYTVHLSSTTGQTGLALAEFYAHDDNGRIMNLSIRTRVRPGDGALIGGFVVQGPAYKRLLLRAIGPTLASFGVGAALEDPVLTIYAGQNVEATNDDWSGAANAEMITAATTSVGAFALAPGSLDAAILITLKPGAYTVDVRGKERAEGITLLEIYDVP